MPDTLKLTPDLKALLAPLQGWRLTELEGAHAIEKTWRFADFHKTMAFINAVAGVAHRMNHHPEMLVRFSECTIRYSTHDQHGLTTLDRDAAALIDELAEGSV